MSVFIAFGGTLILIFVLGRTLLIPLKYLGKLIFSSIVGAIVLIAINYIGVFGQIYVPVNVISAVIVGVLGLPGAIMLILFQLI